MSEQEQQRQAMQYQEWCAERDAYEEQQYHIYLEDRIAKLEAKLDRVRGLRNKSVQYQERKIVGDDARPVDPTVYLKISRDDFDSALGDEE